MSARAETLVGAACAAEARALPASSDAPLTARSWIYGRLLRLEELPLPSRVVYTVWCRWLRQPRPEFYDLRGSFGSRAEARAECRDALDYVLALPYGRSLGRKVTESPTFCRPLWEPHRGRDAEHAALYSEDLATHFSAVNLASFRQVIYEFERQRGERLRL